MSKTKKEEKLQDKPEQSTPPEVTATITETTSSDSTTESIEAPDADVSADKKTGTAAVVAEDLACPICGSDHSAFQSDQGHVYCGGCGTNATAWAVGNNQHKALLAWKAKYDKRGVEVPEGTPVCGSISVSKNGVESKCDSTQWQHDGTKLVYCGTCGANYKGEQPENVAEIIERMGRKNAIQSYSSSKPWSDNETKRLEEARRTK